MPKNIKIAYILSFLFNALFWLGIWVLYYLLFTNYSGIGLIETVAIASSILAEIPTGAVADLLGKKKTLMLAFLVAGAGNLYMALANSFSILIISVAFIAIGHSFYSGTIEALVFDSLKEKQQEKSYQKILAKINSIGYISSAIASIIGGFIYTLNPRFPHLLVSFCFFIALIICFFLKEPSIDTEKFSLKNYNFQVKQGFKQLFSQKNIKKQSLFLLTTGFFSVIAYESLIDLLAVDLGFKSQQLGFLFTAFYFSSALFSRFTPKLAQKLGNSQAFLITNLLMAIIFMTAPAMNLISGAILILLWAGLNAISTNIDSSVVNHHTQSKYRATTISTLMMLKRVPYIVFAYFIGNLIDQFSVRNITFVFGIALLLITLISYPKKTESS